MKQILIIDLIQVVFEIFYIIVLLQEASKLFFPVKAPLVPELPELSETSIAFFDLDLDLDSFSYLA